MDHHQALQRFRSGTAGFITDNSSNKIKQAAPTEAADLGQDKRSVLIKAKPTEQPQSYANRLVQTSANLKSTRNLVFNEKKQQIMDSADYDQ